MKCGYSSLTVQKDGLGYSILSDPVVPLVVIQAIVAVLLYVE